VSVFTTYVAHYLPGFKVTRHGFKRVGEFMRFMMTGSPYCVYSVSDNVLLMAPRERATGTIMEDVKGLIITSADGSKYNSVFNVPAGEPFIRTVAPIQEAEAAQPKKRGRKPKAQQASPQPQEEKIPQKRGRKPGNKKAVTAPAPTFNIAVEGTIRKWIKGQFEALSAADALPLSEVRKLTTEEYAQATFGIRTPIFREIETRSNLNEQRTANGKIKYWKESFRFNGRTYIIYKEWVAGLHQERFVAWLAAHKK